MGNTQIMYSTRVIIEPHMHFNSSIIAFGSLCIRFDTYISQIDSMLSEIQEGWTLYRVRSMPIMETRLTDG